jgi:sulfur carrier protein ThiS adenylyltransferase
LSFFYKKEDFRFMQWNLERYQKNGDLDQGILQNSKIFVVGLGGLGGYAIEQLARLGVGKIIGVDCDVFETSNLNRQRFANENSIGKQKPKRLSKKFPRSILRST